ncbi:MAG: HD domain-containing phosphohydrolase [Cetobacterium sp.]
MRFILYIFIFTLSKFLSYSLEFSHQEKKWLNSNKSTNIYFLNTDQVYLYKDKDKIEGLYVELFEKYESILKSKFNFIDLNKSELVNDINNANLKLVFNVVQTPEREKHYHFINSLISYDIIALYKKNNLDLNNFENLKIGIISNTSQEKLMKQYYSKLNYEYVDTYKKGFELLEKEEIDFLIAKNIDDISNKYYHFKLEKIPTDYLKIAILKDEVELISVIKKLLKTFNDETVKYEIIKKSRYNFYKKQLVEKDFYKNIKNNYSELVVLIPDHDVYPLFYKKAGLFSGYIIDRLEEFSSITSIPIRYTYNPQERYDVRALDSEAGNNERYLSEYYEADTAVFTNKKNEFLNSLDEIKNKRVGAISIRNQLQNTVFLKNNKIVKYSNIDKALNDLADKKIDYFLGDYKITSLEINLELLSDKIFLAHLSNIKNKVGFGMFDKNLYNFFNLIIPKTSIEKDVVNKIFIKPNISFLSYKLAGFVLSISLFFIIILIVLYKKAIDNSDKYKQILDALVDSFEKANELNDTETGEHTKRLNLYSAFIAKKLNCSNKFISEISKFASLHDIGKIGVSDSILKKPGKLTAEEFEKIKEHSKIGFELISRMKIGEIAENIAFYHHEKWNGTGYPKGLKELEIPLEARIVALADVYDALRQKRVYKDGFTHEEASEIIIRDSGKHFDPEIVVIFEKYNSEFEKIFIQNS